MAVFAAKLFGRAEAQNDCPDSPIEKDPNRPLIERALAMGIPMTQVARRYGYGTVAIKRFRDRMPQQLKAVLKERHRAVF